MKPSTEDLLGDPVVEFIQPTSQEFFDKTIKMMIDQGTPAMTAEGHCSYLLDGNKKCAVGHHIPDGHRGQLSSGSFSNLLENHPDLVSFFPESVDMEGGRINIADDLQTFHDDVDHWDEKGIFSDSGFTELRRLASLYGLETPSVLRDLIKSRADQ